VDGWLAAIVWRVSLNLSKILFDETRRTIGHLDLNHG
jgi:hypothetical protein